MNSEQLYTLRGVKKYFAGPSEEVEVLNGVELDVFAGESVAILGASGSGKSTLLHILGTLDLPSEGKIEFGGRDMSRWDDTQRAMIRRNEIGFIFQFHHLLPEFNTLENVAMPGIIAGYTQEKALYMAEQALEQVELMKRKDFKVTTLSGGERQRAAVARAIVLRPRVLLADEPTGSLDEKTGKHIGDLLVALNKELGMAFVVVTHNIEFASVMGRRLELRSGALYAQQ